MAPPDEGVPERQDGGAMVEVVMGAGDEKRAQFPSVQGSDAALLLRSGIDVGAALAAS